MQPERDSPETETDGSTPASVAAVHARRMLGRYELVAEIAKGGMGTVYLARLEGAGGFERLMAVKLMHEHLAEDDAFVTMLLDEARTAANIQHPNAVGILDVAESPLGHYLVMEYVDGFPLSHVITHPDLVTRDRIRVGMRLLADAAHGLHAAHTAKDAKGDRLGIVHRDVSPQNVLVGTDGMGRIVDFGIALAASRVAASRPGSLKGKPQYMAPEQARGEPCDARTDVFALGVIAWEILTYERLFFGEMDVAILVQVMECEVPSPLERDPNLPAGLASATMKALGRLKNDRFASARDFAIAIERAAEAAGLLASSHEVEEILGQLFADETAAKNAAIRLHLSRSGGSPVPLQKGELGLVSRLFDRKLAHKPRVEMATRTGVPAGPTPGSGVRDRSRADVEAAPTATNTPSVVLSVPVVATEGVLDRGAAQPAGHRLRTIGAVLAICGVALFALALGLFFSRAPATPAATTASVATTEATAPEPVVPTAPVVATDTVVLDEEPVVDVAVPEVAGPPVATRPSDPAPRAATPPRGRDRHAAETAAEAGAAAEVSPPPPAAPPAPPSPTLETNPYQ